MFLQNVGNHSPNDLASIPKTGSPLLIISQLTNYYEINLYVIHQTIYIYIYIYIYFSRNGAPHKQTYATGSYNKNQQAALFLNFISVKNSTCFEQIYCPSSGVLILYSQHFVFVILVMLTVC
jgi:hypothetical protein